MKMSSIQSERADDLIEYVIAGEDSCEHTVNDRSYLGHMGANAMYQCAACGAVVVLTQ